MDDLALAKAHLTSLGRSLVVVREGRVVAEDDEPGIAATLSHLERVRAEGPGAVMADRIVGRAAAWAALWAGIEACYGALLCQPAESLLTKHGLRVEASRRVAQILNRARSGPCPMDEAVAQARSAEEAVDILLNIIRKPKT